jgi:DNA-directed RNA polymerase specialized sigma24 family protein
MPSQAKRRRPMDRRIASLENRESNGMRHIFLSEMNRLLQSAYFLTGSHEQAAECFLEAWESCMDGLLAGRENAFQVARRAVVKAAIRRIAEDVQDSASADRHANIGDVVSTEAGSHRIHKQSDHEAFRQAVLSLNAFRRAALVLRLYENYSSTEAASLLKTSRRTLEEGWQHALLCVLDRLHSMGASASPRERENGAQLAASLNQRESWPNAIAQR